MTMPAAEQRLRVLVLTNHFRAFGGSEIVALQTALWFAARGDTVTLGANVAGPPIAAHAVGIQVTSDIPNIDPSAFDLIWCQHDMLGLLPISRWDATSLPQIACVSLSPYEPYEHLNGPLAHAFSADVYANSAETADVIAAANHGLIQRQHVKIFFNAAPNEFWITSSVAPPPELKSILIVSNHPPEELDGCAALLEQRGVHVRRLGGQHEVALLTPVEMQAADAVVTIGKSVVYSIAQGKPVFIYDINGGDGWLTRDNFLVNKDHNFSGRPAQRRLDAENLAAEILRGYARAADEMTRLGEGHDLTIFRLDTHLAPLRDSALQRNMTWPRLSRRLRLESHLRNAGFRAHMEATRKKVEVMRQLRRQLEDSPI